MNKCKPCSIAAAVGFALDICEQENIEIANLTKIKEEGYKDDQEVRKALDEFSKQCPDNRKLEAKAIQCFAFSDDEKCKL